ncbi:MAG: hypothetical protein ACO3UU_10520, partial [Minisyncoccia bacterium]
AQLNNFGILSGFEQMTPIFPTSPTNIEDVFKNYINAPGVSDPLLIQYERLVRFRTSPFYRNKKDQLVYYLYSTNLTKVMDAQIIISDALDREDSAGQDVNAWVADNIDTFPDSIANVFFHSFRVYQADETRDILELASARTVFANKIIVEYDYHTNDIPGTLYT